MVVNNILICLIFDIDILEIVALAFIVQFIQQNILRWKMFSFVVLCCQDVIPHNWFRIHAMYNSLGIN